MRSAIVAAKKTWIASSNKNSLSPKTELSNIALEALADLDVDADGVSDADDGSDEEHPSGCFSQSVFHFCPQIRTTTHDSAITAKMLAMLNRHNLPNNVACSLKDIAASPSCYFNHRMSRYEIKAKSKSVADIDGHMNSVCDF